MRMYSIDESFLGITGGPAELVEQGRRIRGAVGRHTGLPVCVGIAPTKTLAKFANRIAKQNPQLGGVCNVEAMDPEDIDLIMSRVPVTGIWGVAGRLGKRLNALGIFTISDLREADPVMIGRKFSVVLQRTVLELRGTPCIQLETVRADKKQMIFSRSFSTPVTTIAEMHQVMSPIAAMENALIEGMPYAKAGVILTDLSSAGAQPTFDEFVTVHEQRRIGELMGHIKDKYGATSIGLGRAGMMAPPDWTMARKHSSPRYTTEWDELAVVKAG